MATKQSTTNRRLLKQQDATRKALEVEVLRNYSRSKRLYKLENLLLKQEHFNMKRYNKVRSVILSTNESYMCAIEALREFHLKN